MSQVQFRKSFPMKEGRRYLIGYPVDLDPLSIFWVMVDGHGGFCYNWTCYDLGLLNPISNLPSNLAWIMMWHINVNLTPKHWVYLYNRDILGGKSSTAPKKVPRFCSGIMERDETYAVRTWCNGLLLFYPQPCHLKINIVSFSILVKKHIGSINSTKLVKLFFFSGHIDLLRKCDRDTFMSLNAFRKAFSAAETGCKALWWATKTGGLFLFGFFWVGSLVFLVFWMCLISMLKASFIELTALLAKWHGMLGHEILTLKFRFGTFARGFFNQGNHCQSSQLSWLDRANSAKSYSSTSGTSKMWWEFHGRDDGHYKVRCQFSRRIAYRIVLRKMWIWVKTLKKACHLISRSWSLLEYDQRQHLNHHLCCHFAWINMIHMLQHVRSLAGQLCEKTRSDCYRCL